MPALIVLLTVITLLVGGQALFLDVLRLGLVVALVAATVGVVTRSFDGRVARDDRPTFGSPVPAGRGHRRAGV
jgi:hypothetical protein